MQLDLIRKWAASELIGDQDLGPDLKPFDHEGSGYATNGHGALIVPGLVFGAKPAKQRYLDGIAGPLEAHAQRPRYAYDFDIVRLWIAVGCGFGLRADEDGDAYQDRQAFLQTPGLIRGIKIDRAIMRLFLGPLPGREIYVSVGADTDPVLFEHPKELWRVLIMPMVNEETSGLEEMPGHIRDA